MSHSQLQFFKAAPLVALATITFCNAPCYSNENGKQETILGRPKNTVGDFSHTLPRHVWRPRDEAPLKMSIPDPISAIDHNKKGIALVGKGLWEQAIREHHIALLEEPTNPDFRKNLENAYIRYGDLLRSKKDFPNAINQYRNALYIVPSNSDAQKKLTDTLHQLGL